jgi:hypothetical protein
VISPSDLATSDFLHRSSGGDVEERDRGGFFEPVQRAEGGTRTEVTAPEGALTTRITKQAAAYPLNVQVSSTKYLSLRNQIHRCLGIGSDVGSFPQEREVVAVEPQRDHVVVMFVIDMA